MLITWAYILIFRDLRLSVLVFIIIIQRRKHNPPMISLPYLNSERKQIAWTTFLFSFSVIVLAVRGETLRKLMIHAYDMGLIQKNYMFICVYYYSQKNTFGDISWKQVLKNTFRPLKVKKKRWNTWKNLFFLFRYWN